jgi:hypothetical protein
MFFHAVDEGSVGLVFGVRSGGGVVLVLVRGLRELVDEEWVTLMSCCPRIVFRGFDK